MRCLAGIFGTCASRSRKLRPHHHVHGTLYETRKPTPRRISQMRLPGMDLAVHEHFAPNNSKKSTPIFALAARTVTQHPLAPMCGILISLPSAYLCFQVPSQSYLPFVPFASAPPLLSSVPITEPRTRRFASVDLKLEVRRGILNDGVKYIQLC